MRVSRLFTTKDKEIFVKGWVNKEHETEISYGELRIFSMAYLFQNLLLQGRCF